MPIISILSKLSFTLTNHDGKQAAGEVGNVLIKFEAGKAIGVVDLGCRLKHHVNIQLARGV